MSSILFKDINLIDANGVHMPHAYVGVRDGIIDYVEELDPLANLDGPSDDLLDGLTNGPLNDSSDGRTLQFLRALTRKPMMAEAKSSCRAFIMHTLMYQ